MSTLIQELEQAVGRAEEREQSALSYGNPTTAAAHAAEAARLRKRIEHVERMAVTMHNSSHYNVGAHTLLESLAGDL